MKKPKIVEESYSTRQFYIDDYPRTLFPLSTNRMIIENGEEEVIGYINECRAGSKSFLPQHRVYAAKDSLHLRRTVKLDVVAEYFIYDLVYKNRNLFKKPHNLEKRHYGYRFKDGKPSSASDDYSEFKLDVWGDELFGAKFIGFDVSHYFNNIYHHDLEAWLAALGTSNDDVQIFSKFLREINSGRSVDCLPHGLYPTKMIGNDFLRYIEESTLLKASSIRRFMDDFYIFGESVEDTNSDFEYIQRLLGLKGLSINSAKTSTTKLKTEETESTISSVKKNLLKRRRVLVADVLYDGTESEVSKVEKIELSKEELNEIHEILKQGDLEEDDAELILTVMRTHASDVISSLPDIILRFPHLAKNVYKFCIDIEDKEAIASIIIDVIDKNSGMQEYQLFWLGSMLEAYLLQTKQAPKIIQRLLTHPNRTDISLAKILEIPDLRFGLPDIRQEYLRSGRSDWLSWASAVGSRTVKPAARNYALEYFMKSSPMNQLIGSVVKKI